MHDLKDGENEVDEILEIGIAEELIEEDVDGVEEEPHVDPLILKEPDEENSELEEDEEEEDEYDLLVDVYEDIDNF